jgi:Transglycosylase SLT domain
MNRIVLASILLGSAFVAGASSPKDYSDLKKYLALRAKYGIKHFVEIESLEDAPTGKVLEIRGVVQGSLRQGPIVTLSISKGDGSSKDVEADVVPDWLVDGTETPARLLVKVNHPEGSVSNRVVLLGTAKDEDIMPLEIAAAEAAEKDRLRRESRTTKKKEKPATATSSGLFGPIGHYSSRKAGRPLVLPVSRVTPIYAQFIRRVNPNLSESRATRMAQGVVGFCLNYNVDARLVMAVIIVESGFNPSSVSRSGAMGLGQLMPGTAQWMGVRNPFNDIDNIYGMVKLLRTHIDQYWIQTRGNSMRTLQLALAAYNAGEGAVRRHGGVPPYRETQAYVRKVIAIYERLIQ